MLATHAGFAARAAPARPTARAPSPRIAAPCAPRPARSSAPLARPGATCTPTAALSARGQAAASVAGDAGLPAPVAKLVAALARGAAAAALVGALLLTTASPALAARSGGRVGGGVGFSARASAPSFYGGRGASRGSSWGPAPARAPPTTYLRSSVAPLGWGLMPYGMGAPLVVGGGGGGGLADLLTLGVFAFIAYTALKAFTQSSSSDDADGGFDGGADRVTVARLTVGLLADGGRKLQRDLDRLAAKADTSSAAGLHYVLQEAVLALLRSPEYAVYGAARAQVGRSLAGAERKFNALSLAERGKVKTETLVNYGGQPTRSGALAAPPPRSGDQEFVVVTLLLAARGAIRLPKVTNLDELASALGALGGVPASDVLAVEVLWTPQDAGDSYTRGEVTADFPELNNL